MVGSTAVVYPAADLPLQALDHGARLVTLNVEPIEHLDPAADVVLRGTAEALLPPLVEAVSSTPG